MRVRCSHAPSSEMRTRGVEVNVYFKKGLHQGVVLFISLWSLWLPAAYADVTARLSGTVQDQQRAVIAGAKIIATDQATELQRHTTSSVTGEYFFLQSPVGTYQLDVEPPGCNNYVQTGIALVASQSARNDVVMTVGAVREQGESQWNVVRIS